MQVPHNTAAVLSFESWFDTNLTGRENAMTALMVGGWHASQARGLIPAVLEFAELEAFAEAPVRTYSEGMKLRLAFGVVAQLEPDVLLLDEVMAVGDLRFERKCMDRITEMRERGATLVLASHSLDTVERECDRTIWLQAGQVAASGDSSAVVTQYREAMYSATLDLTPPPEAGADGGLELRENRFGTQEIRIVSVSILDAQGNETAAIKTGGQLTVRLGLAPSGVLRERLADAVVTMAIHRRSDGVIAYEASTEADGVRLGPGSAYVSLVYDRLDLLPGEYTLDVGIYRSDWEYAYDFHWQAYGLRVGGPGGENGVFRPPHRWEVGA